MDNYNYDSYCGIYCGACDIMMSYKTGEKNSLAHFWDERTVKTFQKKIGLHYDENKPFSYRCNGCKSDVLFVNCAVCQIRECAINSKVEHCIDCEKYPCEQIVNSKKLELLLPHLKSNRVNMEEIKKVGITLWLSEQEDKWKCPRCKTGFSWYTRKCKNCEENLKKYSFRFSFLLLSIFKLGIYLMPGKK
jgi:hypothetical protein